MPTESNSAPASQPSSGMNFGHAFLAAKSGKSITREAWGQSTGEGKPKNFPVWIQNEIAGEMEIFVQVSNGSKQTYGINNHDLHANDWLVL